MIKIRHPLPPKGHRMSKKADHTTVDLVCIEVECKSHPRTNSRVPRGAVELCCFEKKARMVKILVHYWLRIRSMCVYV